MCSEILNKMALNKRYYLSIDGATDRDTISYITIKESEYLIENIPGGSYRDQIYIYKCQYTN